MPAEPSDDDLVYWRNLPDGSSAIAFTEQGWAMAVAGASLGTPRDPKAVMHVVIEKIIDHFLVRAPIANPAQLLLDWKQPLTPSTAIIAFIGDLQPLADGCDCSVNDLKYSIRAAIASSLRYTFQKHGPKQPRH